MSPDCDEPANDICNYIPRVEAGQAGPENSNISSELSATWETLSPQLQILFSRGSFMSFIFKAFLNHLTSNSFISS